MVNLTNTLTYKVKGLSEQEVAVFQVAVIDTLDQLGIAIDYDEISPNLEEYIVVLAPIED